MNLDERISSQDIRTKIELLCWGLKSSALVEEIFGKQNPFSHFRTGNAGLQMLVGESKLVSNIPVGQRFCEFSPYTLAREDGRYWVSKNGSPVCQCSPIAAPGWYWKKSSDDVYLGKIVLLEGTSTLITAIWNFCQYFSSGTQCAFCAINFCAMVGGNLVKKSGKQIAQAVKEAETEYQDLTLDLTSGNLPTPDHGADLYFDVVHEVRSVSNIPICVEISPPESDVTLERLVQIGVNAFMMNLEVYDDRLRQLFMPGKSQIPRERYFAAYEHALRLVGPSKVSSVLIVGLESKRSTMEGAKQLLELGVIPTIMPFRPNDGSILENFQVPSPDDVEDISAEVGKLIARKGLAPWVHPGCISCKACSVEADYAKAAV